jgi:hypothetical protein
LNQLPEGQARWEDHFSVVSHAVNNTISYGTESRLQAQDADQSSVKEASRRRTLERATQFAVFKVIRINGGEMRAWSLC